jgi:hypothetical protein
MSFHSISSLKIISRRLLKPSTALLRVKRWTQVTGPFENNSQHVPCSAIIFDINLVGEINKLHWKVIDSTLVSNNPYMWVQHNNWRDFPDFCEETRCSFEHLGHTKTTEDTCFPDKTVIPNNMHPLVLSGGDEWSESYQFGKWNKPALVTHIEDIKTSPVE